MKNITVEVEDLAPKQALAFLIGNAEGNGQLSRAEGDRLLRWLKTKWA